MQVDTNATLPTEGLKNADMNRKKLFYFIKWKANKQIVEFYVPTTVAMKFFLSSDTQCRLVRRVHIHKHYIASNASFQKHSASAQRNCNPTDDDTRAWIHISHCKVSGYWLKDHIPIPGRTRNPYLRYSVKNRIQANSASCSIETPTLRLEEEGPERKAYPSPSTTQTTLWISEAVCTRYNTWCSKHSVILPSEAVPDLRCFGFRSILTYDIKTCIARSRHPTSYPRYATDIRHPIFGIFHLCHVKICSFL
jgi:hypothetical protein